MFYSKEDLKQKITKNYGSMEQVQVVGRGTIILNSKAVMDSEKHKERATLADMIYRSSKQGK